MRRGWDRLYGWAAVIVLALCFLTVTRRRLAPSEIADDLRGPDLRTGIQRVQDANAGIREAASPDYVGIFRLNMTRTEAEIAPTALASWVVHSPGPPPPSPPRPLEPDPDPEPVDEDPVDEEPPPPKLEPPPAPPRVQVVFRGAETDLGHAWIGLRLNLPGQAEPVSPDRQWGDPEAYFAPRFGAGDTLRAKWVGRVGGKVVVEEADSGLKLKRIERTARAVGSVPSAVAVLEEAATGREVRLEAGSGWWPAARPSPPKPPAEPSAAR